MSVIAFPAEDAGRDEILEWAARLIEETDISDWVGVMARRKRAREDAALRMQTSKEVRAACAEHVRAFKNRRELDARAVLRSIASLQDDHRHDAKLTAAWPLAWKGLVEIECRIKCNSNQLPPQTEYRIALTDKGRAMIAEDPAP